jgi:glycosyltransferase involved in cell wall biosynthesis
MPPALTILIPAYDEEARLPGTLRTVGDYLAGRPDLDAEILVVDDGSLDRTAAVAREADLGTIPLRVIGYAPNRGKGYAVRHGILATEAGRVLVNDADQSTPMEMLPRLEEVMVRDRLDLVMGSRALAGSQIEIAQSWIRRTMGQTFNLIIRWLTGLPFHDTQCGFKLLRMETMRPVVEALQVARFAWDVEMCFLACRCGLRVAEVPVVWRNSPRSKVSLFQDPLEMLLRVASLRRRWSRGGYPTLPGGRR